MRSISPEEIDDILPQTQCGLCGFGGCMPYAEALIFEKAPIDRCPPGGVRTLKKIAALLQQDPAPFIEEMQKSEKSPEIAVIREAECIGCTKCIQACPVDAIIGSNKVMHTIISDACTGCGLCIPPCPVDCIDLLVQSNNMASEDERVQKSAHYRRLYQRRSNRLAREATMKKYSANTRSKNEKLNYIKNALARIVKK